MEEKKTTEEIKPDCHFQDESGKWMWAYSEKLFTQQQLAKAELKNRIEELEYELHGKKDIVKWQAEEIGKLKEENKTLTTQNAAYKVLKESNEKTIVYYSNKAKDITGAITTLESEREMNAVLTNEVEELKKQNEELVEALKGSKEIIENLIASKRIVNLDEALAYYSKIISENTPPKN